jgi:general secretion pathway protein A
VQIGSFEVLVEAMDLLSYWNLAERPFENTWDVRFFFQSRDHDEALSRLGFLVGEQTMLIGMLTGEIGCGKTLTRAVFTDRLDRQRFRAVIQENSAFSFSEMLGSILEELDPTTSMGNQTKHARWERLRQMVEKLHYEGRHLVLIFDEAQEMASASLNELKLLSNLNGAGVNYLTIVLVGQPELRAMVSKQPAINQRISLRFHLNPLDLEETGNYLRHRLRVAGHPTGDLFPPESTEMAFQVSKGVPRELNRIAKLALEFAWVKEFSMVTQEAVEAVIRDLQRHQNLPGAFVS